MTNFNLYYFFNNHHKVLVDDYFLPSFHKHNKVGINLIGVNLSENTSISYFGTNAFKNLMIERVSKILNLIETDEKGKKFIVSDSDIQFFSDIYPTILNVSNENYDIVFQKETKTEGVNFGFTLISSNQNSFDFFKRILDVLTNPSTDSTMNDQTIGNKFLDIINYSTFDESFWNWSQQFLKKDIKLHHANCVTILDEKISQLNFVKDFVSNRDEK